MENITHHPSYPISPFLASYIPSRRFLTAAMEGTMDENRWFKEVQHLSVALSLYTPFDCFDEEGVTWWVLPNSLVFGAIVDWGLRRMAWEAITNILPMTNWCCAMFAKCYDCHLTPTISRSLYMWTGAQLWLLSIESSQSPRRPTIFRLACEQSSAWSINPMGCYQL